MLKESSFSEREIIFLYKIQRHVSRADFSHFVSYEEFDGKPYLSVDGNPFSFHVKHVSAKILAHRTPVS